MLYRLYEARRALAAPVFGMARMQSAALRRLPPRLASAFPARTLRALSDTASILQLTHARPDFGVGAVTIGGTEVPVHEQTVMSTPFATLLRFAKASEPVEPRVLVIPGLAGHFATLVRGTVRTLLQDHDVYVADWHNARDVPARAGRFGLDEYIEHLIHFLAAIGPRAHLMAVCQPCPAALAAAAIMAQDDHPAKPRSLILMAGPVDVGASPGPVNEFAQRTPLDLLERTVITTVPWPHKGAGRRVYPAFVQIVGFLSLAPWRHTTALAGLFRDVAAGNDAAAARTKAFYQEYFAVMDATAEFYLDTAKVIFRNQDLAQGRMKWRGRLVDPGMIKSALLTIEGENDELCPPGQTHAAHRLCTGVSRRRAHVQAGVGHYGVFSGTRFEQEIYPQIKSFVAENDRTLAPIKAAI